jgi:hypothetical protein
LTLAFALITLNYRVVLRQAIPQSMTAEALLIVMVMARMSPEQSAVQQLGLRSLYLSFLFVCLAVVAVAHILA